MLTLQEVKAKIRAGTHFIPGIGHELFEQAVTEVTREDFPAGTVARTLVESRQPAFDAHEFMRRSVLLAEADRGESPRSSLKDSHSAGYVRDDADAISNALKRATQAFLQNPPIEPRQPIVPEKQTTLTEAIHEGEKNGVPAAQVVAYRCFGRRA